MPTDTTGDLFRTSQKIVTRLFPGPEVLDPEHPEGGVFQQPTDEQVRDMMFELEELVKKMVPAQREEFFAWLHAYVRQHVGHMNHLMSEYKRIMEGDDG